MLKVKDLNVKSILKKISFTVDKGHIAILLGGSGAGKSTLLRALNGLEDTPLDADSIGIVFQHFNLFPHLTVEENVSLALTIVKGNNRKEAQTLCDGLLSRFGLYEKAKAYPHQLSGGQKQRLSIARTLALNPRIICLDEPTSALDPILTEEVANIIHELAREGRTVLVATHDMQLVKLLDGKLLLMQQGEIIETATKQEFEKNPSAYQGLLRFLPGKVA